MHLLIFPRVNDELQSMIMLYGSARDRNCIWNEPNHISSVISSKERIVRMRESDTGIVLSSNSTMPCLRDTA